MDGGTNKTAGLTNELSNPDFVPHLDYGTARCPNMLLHRYYYFFGEGDCYDRLVFRIFLVVRKKYPLLKCFYCHLNHLLKLILKK